VSAEAAASATEVAGHQWLWWTVGAVLLLTAAAAAIWRQRDALLAAWERRQAQRQASEAGCFTRLLDACRAGDAKVTYNALLRWLDCTHRGAESATIEDFLVYHPDADLRRQVEALQESILGRGTSWSGATLANALRRARRQPLRRRTTGDDAQLPALNPVWPTTSPPA
jgi:hypothetical protein